MKTMYKFLILLTFLPLIIFLASCSETAENEHLPEYCQTYSGFMATASKDLYELVDGINRDEYLTAISVIELEFNSEGFDHEIDLSGIQCFQNLTSLTLTGPGFKDISPISALKNIQKIFLDNTSIVSIDSFKNLSKINQLVITNTKTLQSVDGVEEMIKLTRLELTNNGIVNIDGLNNLINLESLVLSHNEISFFPEINQLTKLTSLDVSYNNIDELGDDLSGFSALTTLNMSNNEICDLTTLDDLVSLTELDLSFNNLGCDGSGDSPDFSSLENSVNLTSVKLNDNDLDSIEGLRGLDIPLTTLELQNNNLIDITPISDYTGITGLILYGNNIQNISDLSGMTGLTVIDLSENSIIDFSDLLSIPNLETIYLSQNNITFIPDLVTVDEEFWPHLIILDLSTNNLTNISGVEGHSNLQELLIADNGLTEISGLSDLPMLDYLEMTWEDPDPDVYPTEEDWPEEFYSVSNPNIIDTINNSFNNLPNLPLYVIENEGEPNEIITHEFDFGFELGEGLEIYSSINGLLDVAEIDFSGLDINVIDGLSINLPNLQDLDVSNTNIEDIGFILGNPELVSIDISNTAVSNLSVISGLNTTDLDNLDQVNASNISGDNHLIDSFIELPELSIIVLEGTNILSIDNSFNSLVELTTFRIDSTEIESIVDSFNDIYDYYRVENFIRLNNSKIAIIDGSFNTGNYYFIEIEDNDSTGVTYITDSFNDLTTSDDGYIEIIGNDFATINNSFNNGSHTYITFSDNAGIGASSITSSFNNITTLEGSNIEVSFNDFRTITDSFNNVTTNSLLLNNNFIESITTSFDELNVIEQLDLQINRLSTLVGLDQVTNVPTLDISSNRLTTVSFIDGIAGLTELDISSQIDNDGPTISLSVIDGINNMPGLVTLVMDFTQITEIDGFKNIGITELYISKSNNGDALITSITSDSFTNTAITDLDLYEHNFDNIDFLSNFTELLDLTISIDFVDISYFETAVFETQLESLTLENVQDTTDFSSLNEYDNLTYLGFGSADTLIINNLDGLDSLSSINFVNRDDIEEFNNSFNTMPSLNLSESYLALYDSLTSIDSSFDIYSSGDAVEIGGSVALVDSFNNVGEVILTSDLETLFYIDALSFDNMDTLTIETSNHDSYAILNTYANLNSVTIENLNKNITDLTNSNITSLIVENTDSLVDTFTMDIAPLGILSVNSDSVGTVNFNTINDTYDIEIPNGNTIINIDNSTANISGIYLDLTLNSSNVVTVELSNYAASTTTFNSDVLNQIIDTTGNAVGLSMTVNSLVNSLDIDMNADSLYINDINANNYTINTNAGDAYLNTNQADLIVDFNGSDLYAEYNLLETMSLTGTISEVILNSTSLDTATFNNSSITTATITSNQATLGVTGTNVRNIDIINNSINNLSVGLAGTNMTLATTNNEILNLDIAADRLELTTSNVSELIMNTASEVNYFNIVDGTSMNTITLNNAAINDFILLSSEVSLDITATDTLIATLDMDNLNTVSANAATTTFNITSTVASMDLDMIANHIFIDNVNMIGLNIQSTSSVDNLHSTDSAVIDNITANAANIAVLNIYSDAASMNVTGSNIVNTYIVNHFIVGFTADLGLNDLQLNSTKTGSASFNITAGNSLLSTNLSTISIDNTSTIAILDLESPNLTNLLAGSANLTDVNINDTSLTLDVTGTNVSNLAIAGVLTTLDITTGLSTNVLVENTGISLLNISTNTSDITVSSLGDIDLTSSTLTASTIDLGNNDATLNITTPALDFTINGFVDNLSIDSSTLNNLNIGAGLIINNELELLNTNETVLDLSNGTVGAFTMSGNTTSLNLTGNDLVLTTLDLPNLNNLTINSTNATSSVNILSSDTTIDLNGNVNSVSIIENTLTTVDLTNITIDSLLVNSDAFSSLDTLSSIATTLDITTNTDNFDLTTDLPIMTFNSAITHNLNLTTTSSSNLLLTTNVDGITFNTPTTHTSIIGDNISNLTGTVSGVTLNNTGTGTLIIDLDSTTVNVENTTYTTINTTGVNTIDTLTINGSNLATVDTNAVAITNFNLGNTAQVATVDTEAAQISIESFAANNSITLNYNNANPLDLFIQNIDNMFVNASLSSTVNLSGNTITNFTISGNLINSVSAGTLIVSNKYTMNNTLIDDLSWVIGIFTNSLTELEVNTLDPLNTSSIVEKLRDTGITLISPITGTNVYDYFYDSEFSDLTALEVLDSTRYNGFRDAAILNAFTEIRTNTYFDYHSDIDLNATIDAQSYGTMQDYLDSYVASIGTTEAQLEIDEGLPFVQAIRDSIQATLDETVLIIVELDLTNSVEQSIIDDSNTYATTESGLVGFTIG